MLPRASLVTASLLFGAFSILGCHEDSSATGGAAPASTSSSDAGTSSVASTSSAVSTSTTSGSSSAATTGGGPCDLGEPSAPSAADCAGYCDKIAEGACPADPDVAACTASCIAEVAYYAPDCDAETVAVVECWKASTTTCNPDGHGHIGGCDEQVFSFNACTACVAIPDADACTCCQVSDCCVPTSEMLHDADFPDYAACRVACNNDPGCWEDCDAMYPQAGNDFLLYNMCLNSTCGGPCFGD